MNWWEIILIIILSFWAMEFVAWATHKYVMHGFLWSLHRDHHVKTRGVMEKNDIFFLIFAIPSWLCIMLGSMNSSTITMSIGTGIALYGLAYFLVHEVLIHQRFRWFRNIDNIYLRALRRAHLEHHRHLGKDNGESFGMLIVSPRFFREERAARKK